MNYEDEESDAYTYTTTSVKEVEIFSCSNCPFESENIDELDEHILLNHESVEVEDSDEDFQDVCEEVLKKKLNKTNSLKKEDVHNINEPQLQICINDDTDVEPRRKRFKKEKDDVFRCGWCNYSTTEKCNMRNHRQTHSTLDASTVYKCSQCPYETKRKNDMPKHMLGHCTNVEMFECPECPYKTKRKCDLPKHLLCHKPPDSVPLYRCGYCSYVTKRKGDLPKHVMNHKERSQLNLFNCTECEYVTKRMNDLHKHMLVHCDKHIAGVFKCLKCTYASDKVVRFSKHVQSKCQIWEDAISIEHLMLEDILASVDEEGVHVVLDPDDDEYVEVEEEYQYIEQQQEVEEEGAEENPEYAHYFSASDEDQKYVGGDENGQEVIHGLVEEVLESEIIDDGFVPITEHEAIIEERIENQGVFRINLGEFSVDVAPGSSQE